MSDKLIFDGSASEPKNLSEVIGQAVGAASMCWENVRDAGVFQSERGSLIVQEVIDWIEANYELKGSGPDGTEAEWNLPNGNDEHSAGTSS
jgi:hypothetical protein